MVDPASDRIPRVPPYSGYRYLIFTISDTGLSPSLTGFPKPFSYNENKDIAVLQPQPEGWFGLFRFRSPLLSESFLFSFPGVLRWFSSPSFASVTYVFTYGYQDRSWWVTPFGYPRINGCVLLPAAFRSLPRPSSPRYSKAFTINPFSLDHIIVRSKTLPGL